MAVSSTTLDDILKLDYQGPIQELVNYEALLYKHIEKSKRKRRGKLVYIPFHNGSTDTSDYGDGTSLPASNDQSYTHIEFKHKKFYGTLEFEGDVIEQAGAGEPDAFIDAVDSQKEGLKKDIVKRLNTIFFAGGRVKGFLNQHKNEAAGAVWEYSGNAAEIQRAITAKGAAVTCEFIRADTYAVVGTVNISAVDQTAMTVTLAAGLDTSTLPDGIAIAVRISDAAAALNYLDRQVNGLYSNLFTRTYGFNAIDRTDATGGNNAKLQSQAFTANMTGNHNKVALHEGCFDPMLDEILERKDGSSPDCILMNHKLRQQYVAIQQKMQTVNQMGGKKIEAVNVGTAGVDLGWGNISILLSSSVPKGILHFLKWSTWELLELMALKFQDRDGKVLRHKSGTDNWQAYMATYHELACSNPMENGLVVGVRN
jgi:hypothetical protein